ncbi:hypothetical protein llap_12201 [Limosa lapponica baueri]|uniref:Uncharacterized protein n=1 Tax=Limosa lapponica baueri TaxID=1758121 RepID=A0A2I0TUM6_LIMLA|nr:hypothetical protein llap_12201 [Limosa lapponica baueri]
MLGASPSKALSTLKRLIEEALVLMTGPPPDDKQNSVGMTLIPDPVSSVLQCARSSICPQPPASVTPVITSCFLLSIVPLDQSHEEVFGPNDLSTCLLGHAIECWFLYV